MKIAIAQINPIVGDLSGNQQKILQFIESAKTKEADLVIFPELAITGYPPEDLVYKQHFIDDNKKALSAVAKATRGVAAIVGFIDKDKKGFVYNAASIIENGKINPDFEIQNPPRRGRLIKSCQDLIMLAEVSRSAFRTSFCAGSTDGGSGPNAKCGIKYA